MPDLRYFRSRNKLQAHEVEVIRAGPKSSYGTYVDPPVALSLCDKYGLEELKRHLIMTLKEHGYISNKQQEDAATKEEINHTTTHQPLAATICASEPILFSSFTSSSRLMPKELDEDIYLLEEPILPSFLDNLNSYRHQTDLAPVNAQLMKEPSSFLSLSNFTE